jgi:hypothetical protein
MPDREKPLADQAEPALYNDDNHPAWGGPGRRALRAGSIVADLYWVPGTRLVAGLGQSPICPYAAGIDISEIGPCPLDAPPAAGEITQVEAPAPAQPATDPPPAA